MSRFFLLFMVLCCALPVHADPREDARHFLLRGMAALEMAKTADEYGLAAEEFRSATVADPSMPEAWYNLGAVLEKTGDLEGARTALARYVELAPQAADAQTVRDRLVKLEYRRDRELISAKLNGKWLGPSRQTYTLKMDGAHIVLTRISGGDDIVVIKSFGKTYNNSEYNAPWEFSGVLAGKRLTGTLHQASATLITHCQFPERNTRAEGRLDADAGTLHLAYRRTELSYLWRFRSLLSSDVLCTQTGSREIPDFTLDLKRSNESPAIEQNK